MHLLGSDLATVSTSLLGESYSPHVETKVRTTVEEKFMIISPFISPTRDATKAIQIELKKSETVRHVVSTTLLSLNHNRLHTGNSSVLTCL